MSVCRHTLQRQTETSSGANIDKQIAAAPGLPNTPPVRQLALTLRSCRRPVDRRPRKLALLPAAATAAAAASRRAVPCQLRRRRHRSADQWLALPAFAVLPVACEPGGVSASLSGTVTPPGARAVDQITDRSGVGRRC